MERRDWSIKALDELNFIDSLDSDERAEGLRRWSNSYLGENNDLSKIDLTPEQLTHFAELMQKNIYFLKQYKDNIATQLTQSRNIKKFLI